MRLSTIDLTGRVGIWHARRIPPAGAIRNPASFQHTLRRRLVAYPLASFPPAPITFQASQLHLAFAAGSIGSAADQALGISFRRASLSRAPNRSSHSGGSK